MTRAGAKGSAPRRRTQQERRDDAERQLLEAAARLIAAYGSRGTTFARIGEEAGYSRGVITHYFGTKRTLLERLTTEVQERFIAEVLPADERRDGLETVLLISERYLREAEAPNVNQRAFAVLWTEAATTVPELRPVFLERDHASRHALRDIVARGIRDGAIRGDVDPDVFAASHLAWLRAIALEHHRDPSGFRINALISEVQSTVRARAQP